MSASSESGRLYMWTLFPQQDGNMLWKLYTTRNSQLKIHPYAQDHLQCFIPWHNQVKYLTVLLWAGKRKLVNLQKYNFYHCNFGLPLQNTKRMKQKSITLLWKSLSRIMWLVQCTFVHIKQCHGLAHTKICCPQQVTRQWQE